MKACWLVALVIVLLILSACAAPAPPPAPLPVPTPTLAPIPYEEILASHFGISIVDADIDGAAELGIRWTKPIATSFGPFIWGSVERERGEYIWLWVDIYIQKVQGYNFAILPVIWPFAEWDQANWGPVADTEPLIFEEWVCRSRRKPYDMDAYRRFVSALVERYDGDGIDDMPGLRYPFKYWQAHCSPSVQEGYFTYFDGSPEDYLEILTATYQAVKEADPEAKVLAGGMGTMKPEAISFWRPVFEKGSQYFDIASIHICWPLAEFGQAEHAKTELIAMAEGYVPEFKKLLSEYGIDKPFWQTCAQYYFCENVSPEEHGQILVRSCVIAFACGADKFIYEIFRPFPFEPPFMKQSALVDENGERRPAYYGLKTLIEKLDKFTSAEKLAEGQYRFMVEGEAIYVLWGSGEIPEEITGEVLVTDIYGEETRTDSSAIKLTESPLFVEEHPD
ncbi:hypothetical protein ES703_80737 [subsurface metagenome]